MSITTKIRVGAEWINDFHADACSQTDTSCRDDHAVGFYEEMGACGHEQVFCWGNDNAWERDFRHPDHGGDSLNWLDDVHFCFYSDHGGNFSNVMHIAFSKAVDRCLGNSGDWKLGDKRLKWFVLDCCQCVLNTSKTHVGDVWFPPAAGVHMIFGFVGNASDCPAGTGRSFGRKAGRGDRLGYAWLDEASDNGTAIAMAYGATRDEAINRRENETIAWRDWDVSSPNWLAWMWRD